jgi:hypothetical protein
MFAVLAIGNRAAQGDELGVNNKFMSFIAKFGPVAPPGMTFAWQRWWRND